MQRNYISANLWKTTKTCSSIWCDNELTQEFNKFLRRSGKDTAPGPDRIQYCDIKNLTEEDRSELYTIYQEDFDKGYIPKNWTDSFLRPIPKPRKDVWLSSQSGDKRPFPSTSVGLLLQTLLQCPSCTIDRLVVFSYKYIRPFQKCLLRLLKRAFDLVGQKISLSELSIYTVWTHCLFLFIP